MVSTKHHDCSICMFYILPKLSGIIILLLLISIFSFSTNTLAASKIRQGRLNNFKTCPIEPISEWQTVLESILYANEVKKYWAQIGVLMSMSKAPHKTLIEQLSLFSILDREQEYRQIVGARILTALQLNRSDVTSAIVPHLDSDNSKIKLISQQMLAYVDQRSRKRKPDFSYYKEFLAKQQRFDKGISFSLLNLMYRINPGEALLVTDRLLSNNRNTLMTVESTRYLVYKAAWEHEHSAYHSKNTAKIACIQLKKIVKTGNWWERVYVAAVVSKNSYLCSDEILKALKDDPNELVRCFVTPSHKKL